MTCKKKKGEAKISSWRQKKLRDGEADGRKKS